MKYLNSSHVILIVFILLIMGSGLWSNGGIVLLDFILTPHSSLSFWKPVVFPLLDFLSSTLGYEIVSKIFFFGVLWSAGYLGILLARSIGHGSKYPRILETGGMLFFLVNPYAYERMMVQPTIYFATIALGYAVYFLLFFQSKNTIEQSIGISLQKTASYSKLKILGLFLKSKYSLVGISGAIAFIMMPHASYMILIIFGLYVLFFVRSRVGILGILISSGIVLLLNLNWLIAPFFGLNNSTSSIASFSSGNLEAFQTQALEPMNVWGTNILLYGFWGEMYANHSASVQFLSTLWWIGGAFLLALMIFGLYTLGKKSKQQFVFFSSLSFASLLFGIGIASPLTEGLTRWMIEYLPLWQGYREPQKWIGLVMIVEGIGLIAGMHVLLQKYGKDIVVRYSMILGVLILLLIWSPGPLMGYQGQLRTTVYPEEFAQLREKLLASQSQPRLLAFPWHSYIGCSWISRPTVANPIQGLMSPLSVISSDNIEVGSTLYSNSENSESQDIERFITTHDPSYVEKYNFSHILLMRECASSDSFGWLNNLNSCALDTQNKYLSLYRCKIDSK